MSFIFTPLKLAIVGSLFASGSLVAGEIWKGDWETSAPLEKPEGVEVIAEAAPGDFETAKATAVAVAEAPKGATGTRVLGLRDGGDGTTETGAAIIKSGFSAMRGALSFRFYTRSAHRNGSLLVRLLNREGKALASFQLYAKGHEKGEIQLNTFAPVEDRRMPQEHDLYFDKTWTPAALHYDGAALQWTLSVGDKEFTALPVDASLIDTTVERFEIYTGFGSASRTLLYLDDLQFETL